MKKIFAILFIICLLPLPVSAKKRQSETVITPMKQLQKREFQTHTYNNIDKDSVMKSILNVYQDEGFIICNVNSLLGFIYGTKDFDISDSTVDISKEFGLSKSRLNFNGVNVATVETTANITQYGQDLKVRLIFRRKLLNTYGTAQFIDDINDAQFYQEFFEKIDTALGLQKQVKSVKKEKQESPKSDSEPVVTESQDKDQISVPEKPVKHEKKKKKTNADAPVPLVEEGANVEQAINETEPEKENPEIQVENSQKQEEKAKE